jgi:hypothetical protein
MTLVLGVVLLAAGGLVTSLAEYKFKYNLVDYIVEGFKKVLGHETKAQQRVKQFADLVEREAQKKLQALQANAKTVEVTVKNIL